MGPGYEMFGDFDKAERYREHAAELRKIADAMPDSNAQRTIYSLAAEYDRLAGLVDGRQEQDRGLAALKKP